MLITFLEHEPHHSSNEAWFVSNGTDTGSDTQELYRGLEYKAEIKVTSDIAEFCGALSPGSFSDTGTKMIFSAQEFLTALARHA